MISVYIKLTIAYIAGMMLAVWGNYGLGVIFSVCFIFTCAIAGLFFKGCRAKLLCAVFFAFGTAIMSNTWYADSEILSGSLDRYTEVTGIVAEIPTVSDDYNSYVVKLETLTYHGKEVKINDKIHVTSQLLFDTGNRVRLRGFVKELAAPHNSTEYDYRLYYKSKDIGYKMHAEEGEVISARAFYPSSAYLCNYVNSRIVMSIEKFYKGDAAALMRSVLMGGSKGYSDEFRKVMTRTSAMRFLHPSYMHMYLIVSLCELLFVYAKQRRKETLIAVCLLAAAVFGSDFNSFVRLAIMGMLMLVYRRIRGFTHFPDICAVTILVILIANPIIITLPWFMMSAAVGILQYLFYRPVSERLKFIGNKTLRATVAVWLVGTFGMLPVSAYYFNGVSAYGIIFCFLYTPLSLLLFITAPCALFLYELFGRAGPVGIIVDCVLDLMQKIPKMVQMLPGHYITLGKTTFLGAAMFLLTIAILKQVLEKRYKTPAFVYMTALLCAVCTVHICSEFFDIGNMYVYFVNVDQGDGAVINIKGKDTILIDGGGKSGNGTYDAGEKLYVPYLKAKGFYRIDLAVVSHVHSDHADGIIAAIEESRVNTVLLPAVSADEEYKNKIIDAAQRHGTNVLYAKEGDRLDFSSGLVIDVLSPDAQNPDTDENENSLALKLSYGDMHMFFGGDIGSKTEEKIAPELEKMNIVKASHHGSKNSSDESFVKAVHPDYVVFSAGENNMYGHPSDEAIGRYLSAGSGILRTDTMGDIIFKADKGGIEYVTTFKGGF